MKRSKRVFALFMSAVFALSMVPVQALAAAGSGQMSYDERYDGQVGSGQGSITIANSVLNETYDFYRIFDLASFNDGNTAPGQHQNEAYTYVIREASPWYTFLTTQKLYRDAPDTDTNMAVVASPGTVGNNQLFWIEPASITLKDPTGTVQSDYHVVTITSHFADQWDVSNVFSEGEHTYKYDEQDYVNPTPGRRIVKTVQDFAQRALSYAREVGDWDNNSATPQTKHILPNYIESGTGTGAEAAAGQVVVNTSATSATGGTEQGSPVAGKVYLGWYLMGTSVGSLASLDTTNTDVTVYEKAQKPRVEKRVLRKRTQDSDKGSRNTVSQAYTKEQLLDVENDSDMWLYDTDADVGDYVQFKTVITTYQGASQYVLHDGMERGLTFVNETKTNPTNEYADSTMAQGGSYDYGLKAYYIPRTDTDQNGKPIYGDPIAVQSKVGNIDNFIIKTGNAITSNDGCDFEIEFKDSVADDHKVTFAVQGNNGVEHKDLTDEGKLIVLYWVQVNEDVAVWGSEANNTGDPTTIKDNSGNVITEQAHQMTSGTANGNGRNDNWTMLTYGSSSYTNFDRASVTSYQFDVVKSDVGTSGVYNLLKGAKFSIYKANNNTDAGGNKDAAIANGKKYVTANGGTTYNVTSDRLSFTEKSVSENGVAKKYYLYNGDASANNSETDTTTVLTSSDEYEMSLRGLEAGTYLLFEEEAPKGFNKLAYPLVITITGDNDSDGKVAGDDSYNKGIEHADIDETSVYWDSNEGNLTAIIKDNSKDASTAPDSAVTVAWDAANITAPVKTGDVVDTPAQYTKANNGGLQVINQSGRELPSTGGLGTKMIYTMGVVLLAGAAVLFVTKRRMGAEA